MKKILTLCAVLALGLFAGSCTSGAAGNFQLYLTDAPVAGIEHVYITFSQIEVLKSGEDVYTAILTEPKEVDLLELLNREERIVNVDLEPGTYTAIRLTVSAARVVVNGQTWTLTIDPPKVVTIPVEFTVTEDGTVKCVLDFDAAQSVSENGGTYGLAPVIVLKSIGY
jgi:Domain of unknown function (DUF4382)